MAKRKIRKDVADDVRRNILEGVGYRNPPKHTRFQKGVSGNPAGRPRKPPAMDTGLRNAILVESRRVLSVQENGQTSLISARNAVIRSQFTSAVKGDAYAQERNLKRIEQAEKEEAEEIERINIGAEKYIASCHEAIEAARRSGEPEPEFLPYPDDILIEEGKSPKIVGPASQEELEHYKRACALREILLMHYAINVRTDPTEAACTAFEISAIDAGLPKRMRLAEQWPHVSPYRRVPSARLRKLIRKSLPELGPLE